MSAKDLFDKALESEGISGDLAILARSIYAQESGGGKNTKTSNRGAVGGMQIIPTTFKSVADKGWDIGNPEHNARAGLRYIKQLHKQAGGDPALTAAGYYGGPGGLEKARKGVAVSDPMNPNAPNTLEYGDQVVARAGLGGKRALPPTPAAVVVPPAPAAGAPVASALPTVLPAELLGALNPKTPAAQVGDTGAWSRFLAAMPAAKRVAPVEDFKFGPGVPTLSFGPPPVVSQGKPVFDAFKGWKAQV